MKTFKTLIFGLNDYAQLAHFYLTRDSNYIPKAFVVSEEKYLTFLMFLGLPVILWQDMLDHYDPRDFNLFAPIRDNALRAKIFSDGKKEGYKFISYISSKSIVNNDGFIGENCFIQELNNIQPFSRIGNNVVMWAGNHIGHHSVIDDHTTVTSHCVISGHCEIGAGSFLGVNCTIRDGVRLPPSMIIGQGANVVSSPGYSGTMIGNPAKHIQ